MPATEQTCRSPKLMHMVFGISSLVMLIATVLMFADDHAREYKDYQAGFEELEQWTLEARSHEAQTEESQITIDRWHEALEQAQRLPVSAQQVEI